MTLLRRDRPAFGRPGIEPRWTHGGKDADRIAGWHGQHRE
jgi:hypothetical protein